MTPPDRVFPPVYRVSNTGVGSAKQKPGRSHCLSRLACGQGWHRHQAYQLRDRGNVIRDLRSVLHELLTLPSLAE
jgi:hypothetical protein